MESSNVHRLEVDNKEIIIIGTAHISKKSAEEVKEIIDREKPHSVCVELCKSRYNSIYNKDRWGNTDIVQIIKNRKTMRFLLNLILSSYQKRMGKKLGVKAGEEMIQAIESSRENGAEVVLADRNIEITFSRVIGNLSLWDKIKLLSELILSMFSDESLSEEDLDKLKSQDMLNSMLNELTESMPKLKKPLVDERDKYLAQKIKEAPGEKIVAVLGAAHVPGVKRELYNNNDLAELRKAPPKKNIGKIIAWTIPIIILSLIIFTFIMNRDAGVKQIISWILWNGSLSAIGAAIAFAHPLSILTAFIVAPISSLNPLLAAGWFAGLIEVFLRRPTVRDFENLLDDIVTVKGFWNNKVTRTLLVVILANLGSVVGTMISGTDIIRLFFENF